MCINELVPGHCWEQISGLSACWGNFSTCISGGPWQMTGIKHTLCYLCLCLVGKHHTWIPSGRSKGRAQECARLAHIRCDVMCSHVSALQRCPQRSWSSWTICLFYFFSESEQFDPMQSSCSGILTLNCLWSFWADPNSLQFHSVHSSEADAKFSMLKARLAAIEHYVTSVQLKGITFILTV